MSDEMVENLKNEQCKTTVQQGASTQVWAATAPEIKGLFPSFSRFSFKQRY